MQKIIEEYLMGFVPERFLTDERYRNGHINILAPKSGTKVLGMHTPEMKKVAKEIVKSGDWQKQIECWQRQMGGERRQGADLAIHSYADKFRR